MRILFGTDGIRGKAHQYPLDPATMFRLGVVLARRYPGTILIGRDTRESGPEIAGALAAGIQQQGGHGAAYRIAPEVFRRAGAEVRVINDQPNGTNINDNAGAMHPQGLARAVVAEKATYGVAFDGDADRAVFVDDAGTIRDGDEII